MTDMWGLLMSGEVASTVVMFMPRFTKINRFVKRYSKPSACYKWVPVTRAWRVLKVADGGTASNMESSCEYIE